MKSAERRPLDGEDLLFGLIGYPLGHSFSKKYYDEKIARNQLQGVGYELFPLRAIDELPQLLVSQPRLRGLNVTIPYKISVMDYLDWISAEAQSIGAVNCIRMVARNEATDHASGKTNTPARVHGKRGFRLLGYNTDAYGFEHSLVPMLNTHHWKHPALVLGNGGAARAVCFVLQKLGIPYDVVSRSRAGNTIDYGSLNKEIIQGHPLIINTTPLGMAPNLNSRPEIPYTFLNENHLLYDLVYNPEQTKFLEFGAAQGASIKNGYEMLQLQAERNWQLWTGEEASP